MNRSSPDPRPILVLAPHPDDEVLGCGGRLCRLTAAGRRVLVAFLTSGELGLKHLPREEAWKLRETEARRAARILGIAGVEFFRGPDWGLEAMPAPLIESLAVLLHAEQPESILLPHPDDGHPDHQATLPLLRKALARAAIPSYRPEFWAYEVWTPLLRHDDVEDISAVMPQKLRALRAHRSQLKEFDYVRAIRGLNQYRGALAARCAYAEVFQSIPLTSTPVTVS